MESGNNTGTAEYDGCVTQLRFTCGSVVHALMPPHEPDGYTTVSDPFSIGISFTGHRRAVIEGGSGRVSQRTFPPGTCGITGSETVRWLRVTEPSEAVEVYPAEDELARIAHEINVAWQGDRHFLQDAFDPVIWAVCARFRTAALRATVISDLEAECLIHKLLLHVGVRYVGAQPMKRLRGRLDARRLARVAELVESRLHDPPSLREMAGTAAVSPFHFQRLFGATTGWSPHAYVTARRMECARRMLAEPGTTVAHVTARLGFADASHFRHTYRRHFNAAPRGKLGESRRLARR